MNSNDINVSKNPMSCKIMADYCLKFDERDWLGEEGKRETEFILRFCGCLNSTQKSRTNVLCTTLSKTTRATGTRIKGMGFRGKGNGCPGWTPSENHLAINNFDPRFEGE